MFFNTINTLIEHHNFKSANIQVAMDKNGLYAIVNLAVDETKVTDIELQQACATPLVVRNTGEGFDISAEHIIEQIYLTIVNMDVFDAAKLGKALSDANAKTKETSAPKTKSSSSTGSAKTAPKPELQTTAVTDLFADSDDL